MVLFLLTLLLPVLLLVLLSLLFLWLVLLLILVLLSLLLFLLLFLLLLLLILFLVLLLFLLIHRLLRVFAGFLLFLFQLFDFLFQLLGILSVLNQLVLVSGNGSDLGAFPQSILVDLFRDGKLLDEFFLMALWRDRKLPGTVVPSGPGLLFAGRFLIKVSISVLVMGLLRFSPGGKAGLRQGARWMNTTLQGEAAVGPQPRPEFWTQE